MGLATIALVWPGATLRVFGILFGVYLLVTGVFRLAAAFGTHVPPPVATRFRGSDGATAIEVLEASLRTAASAWIRRATLSVSS